MSWASPDPTFRGRLQGRIPEDQIGALVGQGSCANIHDMFRRVIAGVILGPGLLIGSFAWSGFLALRTVFDEDRSREVAEELLDNDEVRSQLAENLGVAIEAAVPDDVPISAEQVDAAALAVLDDPRVTNLILDAFGSTHKAFLGQGDAPESLDLGPVAEVAREQIVAIAPGVAESLPDAPELVVELPTERIPDSSPVKNFLETSVPFLAAFSLVMVLLAFLTTSDRPSVLKRAALWAMGTTVVYLIIGLGVPALLRAIAPAQAEVLAALLTALLRTTLVPSIVLGVVGAGLLIASWVWPSGDRVRSRREAAPVPRPQPAPVPRSERAPAPLPQPAPQTPPAPIRTPAPTPTPTPAPPVDATSYAPPTPPPEPTRREPAPTEPEPFRPTLPTRANRPDAVDLPAWTGEAELPPEEPQRWLPPLWVEGHGWVLDPDDERPPPENAQWVEGVGHIVPGPPPA